MGSGEFLKALGVDGMKWAEAFHQLNPDCNIAEGVMLGWFCNALMAMHDHILGGPVVLDDGSAFFVAEVGR